MWSCASMSAHPMVCCLLLTILIFLLPFTASQQFAGQYVPNYLPATDGGQVAFFNIRLPDGRNTTLINYFSLPNSTNEPLNPTDVQRAVIILHGSVRDAWNYFFDIQGALDEAAVFNPEVKDTNVAILSPFWANTDDITAGWPLYNDTYATNALIWSGTAWSDGAANVLPEDRQVVSSFDVLDQLLLYFDDKRIYPNLHQVVVAGHSRGAQMVHRYAAVGKPLPLTTPVVYWTGNPNSYLFFNSSRPVDPGDCSVFNDWPNGLDNYTIPYETDFVVSNPAGVWERYQQKDVALSRGLNDFGDVSDDCKPYSQGANRGERLYNFITFWPPNFDDTVDYTSGVGHDAEKMVYHDPGVHRIFLDNFNGNGSRSADFGARQVPGDNPHPVDTNF